MAEQPNIYVVVDKEKCFSFGQCLIEAPDVFYWDENDQAVSRQIPAASREAALHAASACPREAIRIEDVDMSDGGSSG